MYEGIHSPTVSSGSRDLIGGDSSASPFPASQRPWACGAVRVSRPQIESTPDGEFKGDDPLSRYESALVVARLLTVVDAKIQSEIEAAGLGAGDEDLREAVTRIIEREGSLTEEQVEQRYQDFLKALSALRDEFKSELSVLAPKLDTLSALIAANAAEIADLKDEVSANKTAIKELDKRISELAVPAAAEGVAAPEDVSKITRQIEALESEASTSRRTTRHDLSLESRAERVESAVADLKSEWGVKAGPGLKQPRFKAAVSRPRLRRRKSSRPDSEPFREWTESIRVSRQLKLTPIRQALAAAKSCAAFDNAWQPVKANGVRKAWPAENAGPCGRGRHSGLKGDLLGLSSGLKGGRQMAGLESSVSTSQPNRGSGASR